MIYKVNDVYTCIQGEGCQTGQSMVLVRLMGCPVECHFCDTKETWKAEEAHKKDRLEDAVGTSPAWAEVHGDELAEYVTENHPGPNWILLTGGEPAEQVLGPLVDAFHRKGYKVAIETSGTALGHLGADIDWVCVSPKIDNPGGRMLRAAAIASADEIKHVIGRPRDLEALDYLLESMPLKKGVQICLQPMSTNEKATELCMKTVQERGWRLSLQVHKYLGAR